MVGMISGLKTKTYEERLVEVGLEKLSERRLRSDMVEVFKIINGFSDVKYSTWFELVGEDPDRITRTRSFPQNIKIKEFRGDIRKNFFTNRVVKIWNNLPLKIKESKSIYAFKSQLKKWRPDNDYI